MCDIDFIAERKILKIGSLLNNARAEDLSRNNITSSQSETLLFYFSNPGKSITDLKSHLQVSRQAAGKLVDKLRSKEYLRIVSSQKDARGADMLIVGGTSLVVYPAAGLIDYYTGNRLVLINEDPTPYDNQADLVIPDKIGQVFSAV